MKKLPLTEGLMLIDLNRYFVDFNEIQNRRFMYYPDGWLILGAEDTCSKNTLAKSHAEEYYEARTQSGRALPCFDEFVRGWIGKGSPGTRYEHGIVHFSPSVSSENIEMFNKAFAFISAALTHGFSDKTWLRGFSKTWEQTIGNVVYNPRSLDKQIDAAKRRPTPKTHSSHKQKPFKHNDKNL